LRYQNVWGILIAEKLSGIAGQKLSGDFRLKEIFILYGTAAPENKLTIEQKLHKE